LSGPLLDQVRQQAAAAIDPAIFSGAWLPPDLLSFPPPRSSDSRRPPLERVLSNGSYLSASPITGSMEPMMTTVSATSDPSMMYSIPCRFVNEGALMRIRDGRPVPSLVR